METEMFNVAYVTSLEARVKVRFFFLSFSTNFLILTFIGALNIRRDNGFHSKNPIFNGKVTLIL
jgi:hypothetical protein